MKENLHRAFEISAAYRSLAHSDKSALAKWWTSAKLTWEYHFLPFYFGEPPGWRLWQRRRSSKPRMKPNYVMTGPIKSGSSDLSMHLLYHPNVLPPLSKEFNIVGGARWEEYYPTVEEQQNLEKEVNGPVRTGYLFPMMHNPHLVDKIKEINPECKIILTLRDPVKRAYSHWKWERLLAGPLRSEYEYMEEFDRYVERAISFHPSIPMDTICGFDCLTTGMYHQAVELWIKAFAQENVMVMDVAEYFNDRNKALEKVQRFLEIPVTEIPETEGKVNENPLTFDPPSEETEKALSEFYQPWNEKLFELTGERFDWK